MTIRFSDPPREIPPGVQLEMLASRGLRNSLMSFVPACLALYGTFRWDDTVTKTGLLAIAAFFLLLGLKTAIPAQVTAVRNLWRMRHGLPVMGRIVSCRFAWDREAAQTPFAKFVSNWKEILARSQQRTLSGFMSSIVTTVVVTSFASVLLVAGFRIVKRWSSHGVLDDETVLHLTGWVAFAALFAAMLVVTLRRNRQRLAQAMQPHTELQPSQTRTGDFGGEHARHSFEPSRMDTQVSSTGSLPELVPTFDLACQVEYAARGERFTAEARPRFTERFDPAGVEQMLFDPERRKWVLIVAGLPTKVRMDARGQWEALPVAWPAIRLALSGIIMAAALAGFGSNLPWIIKAAGYFQQ